MGAEGKKTMNKKSQEMQAFGEMLHSIMHPEERNFTLADVAKKFSELPNAEELIKGFASKPYSRDDFCRQFGSPQWVYDFLSDTMKMRSLEGEIWKTEHDGVRR